MSEVSEARVAAQATDSCLLIDEGCNVISDPQAQREKKDLRLPLCRIAQTPRPASRLEAPLRIGAGRSSGLKILLCKITASAVVLDVCKASASCSSAPPKSQPEQAPDRRIATLQEPGTRGFHKPVSAGSAFEESNGSA